MPIEVGTEEPVDRRQEVELFEEIRREYEFGIRTIKGVAKKLGVHRRMVRQALTSAIKPVAIPAGSAIEITAIHNGCSSGFEP